MFYLFSMIPQADMTSEAHMSPQAVIVILQAEVISQADISLQADTLTRLARHCFLCVSTIPQAVMTSEGNMSLQAAMIILQADTIDPAGIILQTGTRAKLTCPCFYLLVHDSTG